MSSTTRLGESIASAFAISSRLIVLKPARFSGSASSSVSNDCNREVSAAPRSQVFQGKHLNTAIFIIPVDGVDPKGNPGNFRECVDKLPIRPSETRVRARSASEGSGTSEAPGPKPACCRVDTCHGSKACQPKKRQ